MKKIISYVRGLLLIFTLCLSAHAELTKLVVNTTNANVRLKPNSQAIVISSVPLGGILISESKIGNWFKVSLPADETGLVLKGYIHQSLVEVLGQANVPVSGKSSVAATKYRIRLTSANASIRLKADLRSPSIFSIPLGATVLSEEKRGDWYKISSLPDSDGVVISGFVKSEDVELLEEIKRQVEPLANAEPEGQAPPSEPTDSTAAMKTKEIGPARRASLKSGFSLAFPTSDFSDFFGIGFGIHSRLNFPLAKELPLDLVAGIEALMFTRASGYVDISWTRILLSADVRYSLPVKKLSIFAQAGLGLYLDLLNIDLGRIYASGTEFDLGGRFGAGVAIGRFEFMGLFHLVDRSIIGLMVSYEF
jgi:hypothetical protein